MGQSFPRQKGLLGKGRTCSLWYQIFSFPSSPHFIRILILRMPFSVFEKRLSSRHVGQNFEVYLFTLTFIFLTRLIGEPNLTFSFSSLTGVEDGIPRFSRSSRFLASFESGRGLKMRSQRVQELCSPRFSSFINLKYYNLQRVSLYNHRNNQSAKQEMVTSM